MRNNSCPLCGDVFDLPVSPEEISEPLTVTSIVYKGSANTSDFISLGIELPKKGFDHLELVGRKVIILNGDCTCESDSLRSQLTAAAEREDGLQKDNDRMRGLLEDVVNVVAYTEPHFYSNNAGGHAVYLEPAPHEMVEKALSLLNFESKVLGRANKHPESFVILSDGGGS